MITKILIIVAIIVIASAILGPVGTIVAAGFGGGYLKSEARKKKH